MIDANEKFLQHGATSGPQESAARRVARKTKEVGVRLRLLYLRQRVLELQAVAPKMLALNFRGLVRASPTFAGAGGCFAAQSADMMRRFVAGIVTAASLLLLPTCASGNSYMGIPLAAGHANPELRQLAARARAGDKHAQLKLGIAFEEGHGIRQNLAKARKLYKFAASGHLEEPTGHLEEPGDFGARRAARVIAGAKVSADWWISG